MATLKLKSQPHRTFGQVTPYGNVMRQAYEAKTSATGVLLNSDATLPLDVADVVVLGQLPTGIRLDSSIVIVDKAFTADVTASIGFAYVDGVDDAEVPQDDAYFGAGIALSAVARLASTAAKKPVVLQKPANLIVTVAGDTNVAAGSFTVLIDGEIVGLK